MRATRWTPWLIVSGFFMYGCGSEVCVGPFPATCYQKDADGGVTTNGALTVTAPKDPMARSEIMTFTVTGGVGPYSFRKPAKGDMTQSGVFTAPAETTAVLIEVIDSRSQSASTAVGVQ